MDFGQARAFTEAIISQTGDGVGNRDARQARAITEFVSNCYTDNCDLNGRKVMMSFLLMARKWDI